MAFSNWFGAKEHLLKIKSYSINQKIVLGQGAFGIVYQGTDAKKIPIAAKRIDGNAHPRILIQDLNKLMKLDHPNVMKILDVDKNEMIVWMMMPFCEIGDLNKFYRKRDFSHEVNWKVMEQIAAGIEYLHSQDIVHRDIKPGNILVASEIPLQLLLADFDVSKCLDPEVETSLMSSNVGTLAFKAPEFFQRTSPGKIEYHRNVDIYAAGLTFLAILQAEKGKKMLIPHIETPMDDSELHAPSIGLLIAERIKYYVKELKIVRTVGQERNLISQMTCVNPEDRLTAVKVLEFLKRKNTNSFLEKSFNDSEEEFRISEDELPRNISTKEIARLATLFSPSTLEMIALFCIDVSEATVKTLKAENIHNEEGFKRGLLFEFRSRTGNRRKDFYRILLKAELDGLMGDIDMEQVERLILDPK